MDFIPIKVVCRSGYIIDEYPTCFYWMNNKFEIIAILDRWYQTNPRSEWRVANYFKVRTTSNKEYIIKHEIEVDRWFLITSEAAIIPFSCN